MSTVTKKGQVTIPKEFREAYGLKEGEEVVFEKTRKGIVIKPTRRNASKWEQWAGTIQLNENVDQYISGLRGRS